MQSKESENPPKFDPGEEVYFDLANYGTGKGLVAAFYVHSDGSRLYAVLPNTPRISQKYGYISIIVGEDKLISAPF